MINLHTHTNYSDGIYSPNELLKMFKENNINICSITDHDTVEAYYNIDKSLLGYNINKFIPGVELKSTYKGIPIEILGYYINIDQMRDYLKIKQQGMFEFQRYSFKKGIEIAYKLKLKFDERELKDGEYAAVAVFDLLNKYNDYNSNILGKEILSNRATFYRKTFSNPKSPFYVSETNLGYSVQDTINKVHEVGGIAFLAHIGNYHAVADKLKFLEDLVKETNIDGIECYYPSHNEYDTKRYIDFCKTNNLLISGGSDFHGKEDQNILLQKNIDIKNITWLRQ